MKNLFKENPSLGKDVEAIYQVYPFKTTEVKHTKFTKEQLDRLEDCLNYKLNEMNWWGEMDMKPKGKVLLSNIIKDHDDLFLEITNSKGEKVYQFLTDCDRYIFVANVAFNADVTEFFFIEEEEGY